MVLISGNKLWEKIPTVCFHDKFSLQQIIQRAFELQIIVTYDQVGSMQNVVVI